MFVGATLIWPGSPRRRATFTCSFDQALTQTLEVNGTRGNIHLRDFVIPTNDSHCVFMSTSSHGLSEYDLADKTISRTHEVGLYSTDNND